jgi:mRNA interferase MazF
MGIDITRGDIILVNLDPVIGSEQGKIRPAVVIQNNIGNEYSSATIVAPITSRIFSKQFPTNVEVDETNSPLKEKSTILLNQIRTIDKTRIIKDYGKISSKKMKEVDEAIMKSLGLE